MTGSTPLRNTFTAKRLSVPQEDHSQIAGTIAAEVCRVVAEIQRVPVARIRPDMVLEADLGVDSLAEIQIIVALEAALGFAAPEGDRVGALAIVTVADLIEFVTREVARQTELSR